MAVGSVLSAVVLDVGGALVKLPAQCAHFPSGEVAAEPGDVAACDRLELRRGVRRRTGAHGPDIQRRPRQQRLEPRRHVRQRSDEHTSELQSLMRNSYAVFRLKKKKT